MCLCAFFYLPQAHSVLAVCAARDKIRIFDIPNKKELPELPLELLPKSASGDFPENLQSMIFNRRDQVSRPNMICCSAMVSIILIPMMSAVD